METSKMDKIMKRLPLLIATVVFLFFTTGIVNAGVPSVTLHGKATIESKMIILDVFADVPDVELRSFGISIGFDPNTVTPRTMIRHSDVWYLAKLDGAHVPYQSPRLVDSGRIRIVGGRLDGRRAASGVRGNRLPLATVIFDFIGDDSPAFTLDLASPAPFANFVAVGGESLDIMLQGLGADSIQIMNAPVDSDDDGLPDAYEMEQFGSLQISDQQTDTDADGNSDYDEFLGGTNPMDAASKIAIELIPQPDGQSLLCWTAVGGRVYTIEESEELNTFTPTVEGLTGSSSIEFWPVPPSETTRTFYRLKVKNPTAGR